MTRKWLVILGMGLVMRPALGQYFIRASPGNDRLLGGVYGEIYSVASFTIFGFDSSSVPRNVKFKLDRVGTANTANFLVVTPSSGTTPQRVFIGLNPNVTRNLAPGRYEAGVLFTTVDQSPATTATALLTVTLGDAAPPAIATVTNTASLRPEVSPGGMVSISGTSLGPPVLASEFDAGGLYPTRFGNTTVTFNGIAAPLLYVSPSQVNVVVPFAVAGQKTAQVVVSHYGQTSAAFSVPVVDTSPAIFTATPTGSGQGAIQNFKFPNYTDNSVDNPAPPGSVITLLVTGIGVWDDTVQDGSISVASRPFLAKPVSLTIGGKTATILYAGAAPYQTLGKLQLNAIVPDGVASGQQPIVLTIGENNNEQQRVTIAIQ